ncbi:unnamed protein product [Peniophora sp. CBMAI 1063]|nr:unnamed protein product [Peniophora sp. CBMAI 1063]
MLFITPVTLALLIAAPSAAAQGACATGSLHCCANVGSLSNPAVGSVESLLQDLNIGIGHIPLPMGVGCASMAATTSPCPNTVACCQGKIFDIVCFGCTAI